MAWDEAWRVNDLRIDFERCRVYRDGVQLPMQELTAKLLIVLYRHAPDVVSPAGLIEQVWDGVHVSQDVIAQRVRLLREALGDDARNPRYVQTVRGQGYRFLFIEPVFPKPHPAAVMAYRSRRFVWAAVVTAILLWLWPEPEPDLPPPIAVAGADLDAATLKTQARRYMGGHRLEDVESAIGLYERALALKPDDAAATLGLSFALSTRATKFDTEAGDLARAETLARDVLGRDDRKGAAWHALAYALDGQGRLEEAVAAYRRAHALDPADPSAASSAAYLLSVRGRLYEALKMEVASLGAGGRSRYTDIQIGLDLDLLGYGDAAMRWFDKARTLNPGDAVVASAAIYAALRRGDLQHAESLFAALPENQRITPKLAQVGADIRRAAGDSEAIGTYLGSEAPMAVGNWPDAPLHQAYRAAATGDKDTALEALSHAVDLGWRDRRLMERLPFLKDLEADEGYRALMADIERKLAGERALVMSDPDLMAALGLEAG